LITNTVKAQMLLQFEKKIVICHHMNKLHLKIKSNTKQLFEIVIIFRLFM